MQPSRALRDAAKSGLRRAFVAGQRLGVDVLPRHFYSSIPDVTALRGSRGWREPRSMVGVAGLADTEAQLAELSAWFAPEVLARLQGRDVRAEASARNGAVGFGPTEATVLYGFVASRRPQRVVQVGAGVSTAVVLTAARDAGLTVDVVCVDPYPTDFLVGLDRSGEITLVREPAQDVALDLLVDLDDGDLLFVDSTHTVKPGSEVNRMVLEVLPRLDPGVWVHFHDIWFPYDYPRDVLSTALFFWNESPLLHAFLIDNARYTVQVCTSHLHYAAPQETARVVPGYVPASDDAGLDATEPRDGHFPSSLYLRTVPEAPPRRGR